jgi:hypothetical protein
MSSREQFEEWAIANQNAWFPDFTRAFDNHDIYYGVATQAAWEAWQASRAVPIELPDRYSPTWDRDTYSSMYTDKHGDYFNRDQIIAALIAQGYRVDD